MSGAVVVFGLVLLIAVAIAISYYAVQDRADSEEHLRRVKASLPPEPEPPPVPVAAEAPAQVAGAGLSRADLDYLVEQIRQLRYEPVRVAKGPIVGALLLAELIGSLIGALLWALFH